ncbi:MAG: MFS transporter [Leptolyngbyaceae cyanobacterium CAN_BIN12]|nr:MFS transporter [Leptolyngbyaceae cyanobacterium CAN_BIN12]
MAPNPSFEQRLNASELTHPMKWLWALSAGLILLDGFDFFIIGVALPFLQQDFGLGTAEIGAIAVAALAGSLVGSLILGPITDRVGRQPMLIVDVILFLVATLGTVVAWNAASLIVFRFLVGVAIGADYPISVAYITENMPTRLRGRMVISAFTFQAVGALLGALTGLVVIYGFQVLYPDSVQPAVQYAWRWMLGVGLILAIAVGILRFSFLLESPSYHLARGEYDAASKAASILLEEAISLTPDTDPPNQNPNLNFGDLFSSAYRRNTLLASIPWFLQDIATYGIGIFTPVILATLAYSTEDNLLAKEFAAAQGSAIVDLFLVVGFLLAVLLIDRWGRIRLQIIGFLGMAIGLTILAIASLLHLPPPWNLVVIFTGFFIYNLMMNMGPNSRTFLLSGEVFPPSIRASGAGFAGAIAKAGAILGTFTLPFIRETRGETTLLFMLMLVCLFAAGITYLLRVEVSSGSELP